LHVPDISQSHIAGSEIIALLDSVPDIDAESKQGKVIPKVQGRVELKGIHFCYPTRPTVRVLRDFNLIVEPGTHVALVGASGSGKSTIIQLIERFYDPISGPVSLDGQDISELNVQDYRKNLSLVSQEPVCWPYFTLGASLTALLTDPLRWHRSFQHPAWCKQATRGSYPRRNRGGLS